MKKKNKTSDKTSGSDETFPVDTLGIPILIDVVEPALIQNAEESLDTASDNGKAEPSGLQLDIKEESAIEAPAAAHLDQIIDRVSRSVTSEIMVALEPVIRDKVNLALRMYENELLQLPDEENNKKPEP